MEEQVAEEVGDAAEEGEEDNLEICGNHSLTRLTKVVSPASSLSWTGWCEPCGGSSKVRVCNVLMSLNKHISEKKKVVDEKEDTIKALESKLAEKEINLTEKDGRSKN